eukprot:6577856-Heterocapsa_arctica.AAC.1
MEATQEPGKNSAGTPAHTRPGPPFGQTTGPPSASPAMTTTARQWSRRLSTDSEPHMSTHQ